MPDRVTRERDEPLVRHARKHPLSNSHGRHKHPGPLVSSGVEGDTAIAWHWLDADHVSDGASLRWRDSGRADEEVLARWRLKLRRVVRGDGEVRGEFVAEGWLKAGVGRDEAQEFGVLDIRLLPAGRGHVLYWGWCISSARSLLKSIDGG